MPIAMLDDDAHTLADGAMKRFLKMRKWMVLTAASLFLIDTGLLDFQALAKAAFVPTLSKEWVHFSLSVAAIYQFLMGNLVMLQISDDYWETMPKKVGLDDTNLNDLRRHLERSNMKYGEAERHLESIPQENTSERSEAENEVRARWGDYRLIDKQMKRLRRRRLRVYWPELMIDAMRIVPAMFLSLTAILLHSRIWPIPGL